MCARTGSGSCRASSGSRSASSSMEPFRSANSTVTCLRSPSSAWREVRIFSARYGGGGAIGGPAWAGGGVQSVDPHGQWERQVLGLQMLKLTLVFVQPHQTTLASFRHDLWPVPAPRSVRLSGLRGMHHPRQTGVSGLDKTHALVAGEEQ